MISHSKKKQWIQLSIFVANNIIVFDVENHLQPEK